MPDFLLIFLVLAAGTWLASALGAGLIAFVKKGNATAKDLILGFAAGVILMVSFIELLYPAIYRAEEYASFPAWLVVPGAFAAGFLVTLLLDRQITKIKAQREAQGRPSIKYRQGFILFGALSFHSIPEGLAIGILLGALGSHFHIEDFLVVLPVIIAVGLHKFPEGTAIAVAFQNEGASKIKSFLMGQSSGFIGFVFGILGFVLAISVDAILPYAMAFAGGALVWVAVHELIPESKKNKENKPYLATIGVFLGILLMLFVDTTLHTHDHDHGHSHDTHYEHNDHD